MHNAGWLASQCDTSRQALAIILGYIAKKGIKPARFNKQREPYSQQAVKSWRKEDSQSAEWEEVYRQRTVALRKMGSSRRAAGEKGSDSFQAAGSGKQKALQSSH